jgi:uncharacterized protein
MIKRQLQSPKRSFFLFGPRSTGKSTWLKQTFKDSCYIDLLNTALSLELQTHPDHLEAIIGDTIENGWVVIDEIQKIPELLDEVHRLIESRGINFALSGSSARKLKRHGVNLLAGRALTRHFYSFSFIELKKEYDLIYSLNWGMLPLIQLNRDESRDLLSAYVDTYIKEEIKEEGIIRKLAPFLRFLGIAGMLNGQTINALNISREAAVPRSNIDSYFSILEDTLLGSFLPAYRPNVKMREQTHPKFYWFDNGVARAASGFLYEPVDRLWLGTALETLILHELKIYNQLSDKHCSLYYYRTASGVEIDFIIETRKKRLNSKPHIICIEVKMADKWQRKWEKPARSLNDNDGIIVDKMFGIYTGTQQYNFNDFQVLPVNDFFCELFNGNVF